MQVLSQHFYRPSWAFGIFYPMLKHISVKPHLSAGERTVLPLTALLMVTSCLSCNVNNPVTYKYTESTTYHHQTHDPRENYTILIEHVVQIFLPKSKTEAFELEKPTVTFFFQAKLPQQFQPEDLTVSNSNIAVEIFLSDTALITFEERCLFLACRTLVRSDSGVTVGEYSYLSMHESDDHYNLWGIIPDALCEYHDSFFWQVAVNQSDGSTLRLPQTPYGFPVAKLPRCSAEK